MQYKIFLIFLLLIPITYGVGMGGAGSYRVKEIFVPDSDYPFNYYGIGDKRFFKSYEVHTKGPFTDYVEFTSDTQYPDLPPNSTFPATGIIHMPSSMDPGWKYQEICVRESCSGGTVCARAQTCAVFEFLVLYPGIMPKVSMSIKDINPGDIFKAYVSISNEGDTDIKACTGTIKLVNINKTITKKGSFDSKPVLSGKKEGITAEIDSKGMLPGNYEAFATIDCDDVINYLSANFTVGKLNVKILNYTKELTKDSIKKFTILVESGWNDPLDIYANIVLSQGKTRINAKTTTETLDPWAKQELTAYVDTKGLDSGVVDLDITAHYLGHTTDVNDKINMIEESSEKPVKVIEKEVETEKASNTNILTILLIIAVIVLTTVNVYLAIRKKRQE